MKYRKNANIYILFTKNVGFVTVKAYTLAAVNKHYDFDYLMNFFTAAQYERYYSLIEVDIDLTKEFKLCQKKLKIN